MDVMIIKGAVEKEKDGAKCRMFNFQNKAMLISIECTICFLICKNNLGYFFKIYNHRITTNSIW